MRISRKLINKVTEFYYFGIRRYKNISKKKSFNFFEGEKNIRNSLPQQIWPGKCKAAFNFQLDDFSVKSKKNAEYDYGGDPGSGVARYFQDLMDRHPFLKTTIFTIPNPKFISNNHFNHRTHFEGKYEFTNSKYKRWVRWITSNEFRERNEIANHGLYHLQLERKNLIPFCEFEFKTKEQCIGAIRKSNKMFRDIGIVPLGFKPAAWGIGHNSSFGLVNALKELIFEYVCLSSPISGLNWEKKNISNVFPETYQGLLNIPQNINLNWKIEDILMKIDEIVRLNGVITVQAHFNSEDEWMSDGLGPRNNAKIGIILNHVERNYPNRIWFAKLSEIARWWKHE